MSAEQRRHLLDDAANYPLYVTFLDKTGLLTFEEVHFLREKGVDFDVNDKQAEEVLGYGLSLQRGGMGCILGLVSTVLTALFLIKGILTGRRRADH
jgi:hypothetical protein